MSSHELRLVGTLEDSRPARPLQIALINMPWARVHSPSIQCGLLKAGLERHEHKVDVHYLNLSLSTRLGSDIYDTFSEICGDRIALISEWLFTKAACWHRDDDDGTYFARLDEDLLSMLRRVGLGIPELRELRDDILPAWTEEAAESVPWHQYDIAGFTSTFEQNIPAFALARNIKQRSPLVKTIFGGANFDSEMGAEFARALPFIDYAVSGEGDLVFPVIAARISNGRSPLGLPGVSGWRSGEFVSNGQAPKAEDMDSLPMPDYTDYFNALDTLGRRRVLGKKRPVLMYEASRGCWWGEKHHCTFCGLNAMGMAYRSKSPDRVVEELSAMAAKYGVLTIQAVDNIMDMQYLKSVCSKLRDLRWDLNLFFEIKANMSREQISTMRAAGIRQMQPGIESLNTHVLGLMRKGATMLTNVRFLKWSRYYGVKIIWNIIAGFPGETDEDYIQQADLVPSLTHLEPPDAVGKVWLERFSPYFTEDFPIRNIRPAEGYSFVYPSTDIDLAKIAYFFNYDAEDIVSDKAYRQLTDETTEWKRRWADGGRRPRLDYQRGPDWLTIHDTRMERPRRITVRDWAAIAFEYCGDKPHSVRAVADHLSQEHSATVAEAKIGNFLEQCVSERLMVAEDGKYLSLALPRNPNW